ncbi:TPA: hypothetical protein KKN05_004480, partial [Shigella flexneri]|nr:hypothetical protein [Shigella flexneri]
TLVVTDDRGATDFRDLAWVPIDVLPGSAVNPVKLGSKGLTPIALLSSDTFEATTVTPSTLRIGPGKATAQETTARPEDVNGDGRQDQIIHVRTQDLGLAAGDTQLCLTGALDNERPISSCDTIRVK